MRILVLTDNQFLYNNFKEIILQEKDEYENYEFDFGVQYKILRNIQES